VAAEVEWKGACNRIWTGDGWRCEAMVNGGPTVNVPVAGLTQIVASHRLPGQTTARRPEIPTGSTSTQKNTQGRRVLSCEEITRRNTWQLGSR